MVEFFLVQFCYFYGGVIRFEGVLELMQEKILDRFYLEDALKFLETNWVVLQKKFIA